MWDHKIPSWPAREDQGESLEGDLWGDDIHDPPQSEQLKLHFVLMFGKSKPLEMLMPNP